jgi:glycosyltransferase involved in cell wall biosynthesis
MPVRVALLTYNARSGDAIGNHVAEKLAFFVDSGADARVFVESDEALHPGIRPYCRLLAAEPSGDGWAYLRDCDLVVVDYSQWYSLLGLLPLLARERPRILFDYHGVTPPENWPGTQAEALAKGRRFRGIVWCADGALAHSRFARRELLEPTRFPKERTALLGYVVESPAAAPVASFVDLRDRLGLGAAQIVLFVGRLAPNKRVPLLADVLQRLKGCSPPVHAVIIGDNSDIYRQEADACRRRADEWRVRDRLHILGKVSATELRDAYRSADVFVMPSVHEGFCLPVMEAMAAGVPVVAARAAALPETVGDAGLTFKPDDADDCARQILRVLDPQPASRGAEPRSVAIVAPRYGGDFPGGAETSLRTIAESLHRVGLKVEVFTTCARTEGAWSNELPAGSGEHGGVAVHRFPVDANGGLQSSRLLGALRLREKEFDAIIVGPYLFELARDVARAFPEKTLLLPCLHDEPAARAPAALDAFRSIAGVLYHSLEEQEFAQAEVGFNHPGAQVIGTYLDAAAAEGPALALPEKYVVYCGRYVAEKNLPILLEFARDYALAHPERFAFVFMGEGNVKIPKAAWARDLGFVDEVTRRRVLRGAAALIHWSERESLSLVALEAWAQGTPVLCNARCAALAGHLERGEGGRVAVDVASFMAALDDLWNYPEHWQDLGRRGRDYVIRNYGSRDVFAARLKETLGDMAVPLVERMQRRGLARAECLQRSAWRESFGAAVEEVLDGAVQPAQEHVDVIPRSESRLISVATPTVLIPVHVVNRGTRAALPEGPARIVLRSFLEGDGESRAWRSGGPDVPLPGLLMPGESQAAAVPISVPAAAGAYRICFRAVPAEKSSTENAGVTPAVECSPGAAFTLHVSSAARQGEDCCTPLLDEVRTALGRAHSLQQLPDNYQDVCEGRFARLKRWLKQKLLGNFKRAYVDVLSRQQSEFNAQVLIALQELAECSATLDHARSVAPPASRPVAAPLDDSETRISDLEIQRQLIRRLFEQLTEARESLATLHQRVAELEAERGGPAEGFRKTG